MRIRIALQLGQVSRKRDCRLASDRVVSAVVDDDMNKMAGFLSDKRESAHLHQRSAVSVDAYNASSFSRKFPKLFEAWPMDLQ